MSYAEYADDDCEDQACPPTKNCTRCRPDFDDRGVPTYPALKKLGRYWCCPVCGGSYGENPHPDLR